MSLSSGFFSNSEINNFQHKVILQAPIPILVLEGIEFIISIINEKNLELWQRTQEEVLGKPLFKVLPEIKAQPFYGHLINVFQTGVGIKLNEQKAEFYRNGMLNTAWFDVNYEPIKNSTGEVTSIMGISVEITAQVLARKKAENNEKELKIMADAMPHLVWTADGKGNINFYNKRVYEYTGLEITDKNLLWQDIIHSEDLEETLQVWQNAVSKKNPYSIQHRLKEENGSYRWFLSRAVCEEDVERKTYKWFGSSTDIHEQKETELKVKDSEIFNRAVLESSPDCLKIIDNSGRIIFMNHNGQCLLEIDDFGEIKNKKWWDLWGDENKEIVKNAVHKALLGETVKFVAERTTFKGTSKWWDVMVSPVINSDGKIQELIAISRDITEQKRSETIVKQSEEKYRGLFEKMDQGFCIVEVVFDANDEPIDYRFLESNPTFKQQTGLDNVDGKTISEIVPDIEISWSQKYGKVVTTGESIKFIDYSEAMNTWFEVYAFRLGEKDNNKVAIIFTDVTERKKAEMELKVSEERFRSLTETIPQMVWMTDAIGNSEYLSSQWTKYAGEMPKADYWAAMCHPDDINVSLKAWEKSVTTGENFTSEVRLKNKAGEYRWHVTIGIPLRDDSGEIIKWVGSVADTHDQKLKEQKKDEFISIASHEMKTPLTSVKAYLQLLEMSLDESDQNFIYAKKALQANERLNKLIGELLDASKIQHGKLNFTNSIFDFDTMINDTIENVQHSSITHKIIKNGFIHKQFLGDKDRLQQVLINLLTNAIKYSPKANEVIVKIEEQNNHLQISVIDKGIGVPDKHLEKVFERYYRIEEHSNHFQGLGIGLYISFDIISRHNGKMWVESISGEGSTFHFILPFNTLP